MHGSRYLPSSFALGGEAGVAGLLGDRGEFGLEPGEVPVAGGGVPGRFVTCHSQVIVALHPLTREASLMKLRKARSKYLRDSLAQRPDLPALAVLVKVKDISVRIAAQEQTPATLLGELSLDPDSDARAAVHANLPAPDEARAQSALLGLTKD